MAITSQDGGGLVHLPKLPDQISYTFAKDMRSHINSWIGGTLRRLRKSTGPVDIHLYMGTGKRGAATWELEENATLCIQVTGVRDNNHAWITVDLVDHVLRRETGVTKSYRLHTDRLRLNDERERYIGFDTNTMETIANRALRHLLNHRKTELGLPLGYTK